MNILLACDCAASQNGNPFTFELFKSLTAQPTDHRFEFGPEKIFCSDVRFDLIHVHWPEALCDWKIPTKDQINRIRSALNRRKAAGTKIVITIHNEIPHGRDLQIDDDLYRSALSISDGVIHLGERSKEIMAARYGNSVSLKPSTVIPHGDYLEFPNNTTQKEARAELRIPQEKQVILSFGRIRTMEEYELLINGFNYAPIENSILVQAGRLPAVSRKSLRYVTRFFPFFERNKRLFNGPIPSDRVQLFLNAADILLILRNRSLNSGNVSLGFTFRKPVVGPLVGVIGEYLEKTGNPTYEPFNYASMNSALREGLEAVDSGIGETNFQHLQTEMNWNTIATQHIRFYEAVTGSPKTD